MRKALLTLAALALFVAPARADIPVGQVNVDRVGGYYSGSGGEFTLYNTGLSTSAYSNLTKSKYGPETSFQTFCTETQEYIMPPFRAQAVLSTTFIDEDNGSVTGPGSHSILGGNEFGDNLSPQTAFLYTKFATGTLAGYDYTNSVPGGRAASAGALQAAIWWLEGEGGGVSNAFVALADAAVAPGGEWNGKGIGDVRVLNLYSLGGTEPPYGGRAQDQLYLVPAPAAIALGLIGLALVGGLMRRLA